MAYVGLNITGCNSPTVGNDKTTFAGIFDTSFQKIDLHDHTTGKGTQIPTGGIADGAVTSAKLAAEIRIPAGAVMPFAGSSAPSGWLLCYGQAVSRTTYADLFAAISTTYGVGDGSSTFNLPDLRGRAVAGKDDMGGSAASRLTSGGAGIDGTALGSAGGSQTHTLSGAESGTSAHIHTVSDSGHTHKTIANAAINTQPVGDTTAVSVNQTGINSGANQLGGANTTPGLGLTNSQTTGISINSASAAAASNAHQNTQPTMVLNYIIKT